MPKARQSRRRSPSSGVGGNCTAVIGSMTLTMKAQTLLSEAAIRGSIVKLSSAGRAGGCAYGLDFPCTQSIHVDRILRGGGIQVREYLQGETSKRS